MTTAPQTGKNGLPQPAFTPLLSPKREAEKANRDWKHPGERHHRFATFFSPHDPHRRRNPTVPVQFRVEQWTIACNRCDRPLFNWLSSSSPELSAATNVVKTSVSRGMTRREDSRHNTLFISEDSQVLSCSIYRY